MVNHRRKTEKQSLGISRREFCKGIPCAAFGALSLSSLASMTGMDYSARKEKAMAKKIIAVTATVKSVKGTCGLGHKVGDVVKFTENGVEGKICIHALYSMLPAVFAMMYEARFPWLEDPDKKTHPCTDATNPVVFEIQRIREE
jgi:uncharacterized repeat protein (TIGR04076 family)